MRTLLTRRIGLITSLALAAAAAVVAIPAAATGPVAGPVGHTATPKPGFARSFARAAVGSSASDGFAAPNACGQTGGPPAGTCGNLTFHNGWVMHTTHTYAIYWKPSNVPSSFMSANYQTLINRYLTDLGNTSAYDVVTQYSDATTHNLVNSSTFSGSVLDTTPTQSGATGTTTSPVQDADVVAEVQGMITAHGWTTNPNDAEQNFFAVFLPQNVDECAGSSCRSGNGGFCAYHSWFPDATITNNFGVYAVMPYDDSTFGGCTTDLATHTTSTPNGDLAADSEISTLSHELFEAATNPLPGAVCGQAMTPCDGWYFNDAGHEIGDECNFLFGTLGVDGGNETLGGHRYIAQKEWSNGDGGCVQTYPDHLALSGGSGTIAAGTSFGFSATAADSGSNTALGYIGRVRFTSTDPSAVLPVTYTFTAGDAGVHSFNVTLNTHGVQTVTGTDVDTGSIVGSFARTVATNTTTTVVSSANPSVFGQPLNFTATVDSGGQGTATGTVQFSVDSLAVGGQVALVNGAATSAPISNLSRGNHTISASYSGGGALLPGGGVLPGGQTVNKAASSVTVSSSKNAATVGDNVVFTATIGAVGPGAGTPGGTVQFVIDGSNAGSPASLSGGVATYSTSSLATGSHTVGAVYAGDGNFLGSQGTLAGGQVVNAAPTADLSVQVVGPSRAVVGVQTIYAVQVTNNGPGGATGVVATDNLPAGWTLSGASPTQGTCTASGTVVTCALGSLASGANATDYLVVVPHGTGAAVDTASVTADQGDPNTANNSSTLTTAVRGFGYWLFGGDGGVFTFGDSQFFGSTGSMHLNKPIVAMTGTPTGLGYWLFGSDGGVFAYGDAGFFGSTGSLHLNAPIVAMATTPDAQGYWLFGGDGGVFAFGDARFFGSTGSAHLPAPIVGMAATPDGGGYWIVGADGSIYPFGDAAASGNLAGQHLAAPVVGMAATKDGKGYWLVASDGGVFPFGDAGHFGSLGGSHLNSPIVGMAATPDGQGYWLVAADGGVFGYGDAPFLGGMGGQRLNKGILGLASNG